MENNDNDIFIKEGDLILSNIKNLEKSLEEKNIEMMEILKEIEELKKELKNEKDAFKKTRLYHQLNYNKYKQTFKKNYKYVKKTK